MINYQWSLNLVEFDYLPQTSEAQLTEVHWGCVATDSETGATVDAVGSVNVKDEGYIFPAATVKRVKKAQVFQFLNNKLGDEKDEIKATLARRLAAQAIKDSFVPED